MYSALNKLSKYIRTFTHQKYLLIFIKSLPFLITIQKRGLTSTQQKSATQCKYFDKSAVNVF